MAALVENQDRRCELCGHLAVQEHHIMHRSMGGQDDSHNLVTLCSECHQKSHPEKFGGKGIQIVENSDTVLRVLDHDGEIIYERWNPPAWWPQKRQEMLTTLDAVDMAVVKSAREYFRYLAPEEAEEVYGKLRTLDDSLWEATARLLLYAKRRMPYGTRTEKFNALVQSLGIQKTLAYERVAAITAVDSNPELFRAAEKLPPPGIILEAVKQSDPGTAIELYRDRAAQNPRYSVPQFKEDLGRGNTSMEPEPEYCRGHCVSCGRLLAPHVRA